MAYLNLFTHVSSCLKPRLKYSATDMILMAITGPNIHLVALVWVWLDGVSRGGHSAGPTSKRALFLAQSNAASSAAI